MSIPLAVFPDGRHVPALGMGTWRMGEDRRRADEEVASLQAGMDLGMTLIDTAEMYGDGSAETIVGAAVRGRREGVFLVSKVLPANASRHGTVAACEASLRRLGTDRIDLYLLHWPGFHPLEETVEAFEGLKRDGKICAWGVSNFDTDEMETLVALPDGGHCASNQVLYNLARRGIEHDLLPWMTRHVRPTIAYSPLDEGRLVAHPGLGRMARTRGLTPAQLALAFVLSRRNVIAIPKSASPERIVENRTAADLRLTEDDLTEIDALFPPPRSKMPLEII